ncbi:hypothetical protein NQ315_005703 [Exocentrus adspersus]|uniref:DDE Tnp4 domain-containing protein n=1 Tax=Exocentrus adspersus TaxID=1586481 RepID=A0AAV8VHX5_9CUCU|nr:hypothetical protein NQ315_005703 [Exocentrus adspersus]
MPVPTEQKLKEVANDFYTLWKFPNCIVVLQAVADANKKFLTIEVGGRGKQSDGGTFAASTLFQLLESGQFNVPGPATLPETNTKLPYVLIGDEAYPLKPYLLRSFPSRQLTPMQENFNTCLSRARKCIECAFGILRAKWVILGKNIEQKIDNDYDTIKCICILHNVIRERDGNNDRHYNEVVNQIYHEENNQSAVREAQRSLWSPFVILRVRCVAPSDVLEPDVGLNNVSPSIILSIRLKIAETHFPAFLGGLHNAPFTHPIYTTYFTHLTAEGASVIQFICLHDAGRRGASKMFFAERQQNIVFLPHMSQQNTTFSAKAGNVVQSSKK